MQKVNFRTEIPIKKEQNVIDYNSVILLLGSCFSDTIGKKFDYYKFKSISNPFGVIFNVISMEKLLTRALDSNFFVKSDFIYHNEQWHNLDLHSDFSNSDLDVAITESNLALELVRKQILQASHSILTLGTAWVYTYKKTNEFVANCHKIPQEKFTKKLLSVSEIKAAINRIISKVQQYNSNINFIFTLSPVRHVKDGFTENNRSKAHLLTTIHQVISTNVFYFPAYEIMLDDLRDYRFYEADMLHPNAIAVDYIWNIFKQTWLNESVHPILKKVASIQKGIQHKPFNPTSEKHKIFIEKLKQDKKNLLDEFGVDF